MKSEISLALVVLATASVPALAQDRTPECATTNFDSTQNFYTVKNAPPGTVNQQCFLTVLPKDGPDSDPNFPRLSHYPVPQIMEGTYEILLSGGGGGGGGGGLFESAGGGAGAAPLKVTRYLSPGVYRLAIGTGGEGGRAGVLVGERGGEGNPTSISNAYSGETIAGFPGAEVYAGRPPQSYMVASSRGGRIVSSGTATDPNAQPDGSGARGIAGQSDGGDGGRQAHDDVAAKPAQDGGFLKVADVSGGRPGRGGENNGGGAGGAGYGNGGDGMPGGAAGASDGSKGGDGFIALRAIELAQATPAVEATPAVVAPAPVESPAPAVAPIRKRDRN